MGRTQFFTLSEMSYGRVLGRARAFDYILIVIWAQNGKERRVRVGRAVRRK